MIDVTAADETSDDARARGNVWRLAAAQALTGANSAVIFATGSIVGATLAPSVSLATVPLSMYVLGLAAGTLPTGAISRAYGRRTAFIVGTFCGTLTGALGAFAILHSSFWLFCGATFLGGLYGAVAQSYRFAAADGASVAFRPKAVSWVMAGGVFAGVLGPQLVQWTMDIWPPYLFAFSFVMQALVALVAMAVLSGVDAPKPAAADLHGGRPLLEIAKQPRFIAAALSGDTSVRRLADLGEGQANQFAMAKAIASGDPRLMQKAGLEAEIARLERLHAAHIDDQHAIRRQIRDAEREIEISTRRIGDIAEDITRLVPTGGDAFTMAVKGTRFDERKLAGRALMQEILTLVQLQHEDGVVIASIGGFDVTFEGERIGRDGYHYVTMLQRTGAQFEIELPMTVTPLGAVARLEHPLTNFGGEQENHRRRLAEAERRLASYRGRVGEAYAFAAELNLKRAQLADVEADLAASSDEAAQTKGGENRRAA